MENIAIHLSSLGTAMSDVSATLGELAGTQSSSDQRIAALEVKMDLLIQEMTKRHQQVTAYIHKRTP